MSELRIYTAEWVLPISSPPVRDGALVVNRDRISFVGPLAEVESRPDLSDAERVSFGRAAILPGLINVHSHLEITLMRGLLEDLAFRDWIVTLTKTRGDHYSEEDRMTATLLGAAEAIRAGVTTLADTADSRAPFDALLQSGLRGVAYREIFGPNPADAESRVNDLKSYVEDMRRDETDLVRVGVSPHAPYSISAELFYRVLEYAARESLDACIHTAESEAEQQMMLTGEGVFANELRGRGIEWKAPGVSTIKYFDSIGLLEFKPMLIHCVRADNLDIELMARRGARVAHCPKSNAKLGHGIAPLMAMLGAGVTVGLGTDSVASNNRCDIIEEARFSALTHRALAGSFKSPSAEQMLRLATLDGARTLGLESEIGSLDPGKQADFIAIDLSRNHNAPVHDAVAAIIFSAVATDVVLTAVAGRVLFDGREVKTLDEADLHSRANDALRRMLSRQPE